jgi:predicted component of type VI protein secretion system
MTQIAINLLALAMGALDAVRGYLLMEDGTSFILQEDESSKIEF